MPGLGYLGPGRETGRRPDRLLRARRPQEPGARLHLDRVDIAVVLELRTPDEVQPVLLQGHVVLEKDTGQVQRPAIRREDEAGRIADRVGAHPAAEPPDDFLARRQREAELEVD